MRHFEQPVKCSECNSETNLMISCPACNCCSHSIEAVRQHFAKIQAGDHSLFDPFKQMTLEGLADVLSTTIKRDRVSKAICFLDMLNAQSAEDQFNVMFSASSATGKSYIPLELSVYFPEDDIVTYSGASPTSFFHEKGTLVVEESSKYTRLDDLLEPLQEELAELKQTKRSERSQEEAKRIKSLEIEISKLGSEAKILVDLEGKILIFLDQPNSQLLAKLRSFLSHDSQTIEIPITDKAGHGGLRTKHVLLRGFASVIFCTVSSRFDDQEANRNFILSPESEPGKISEALKLLDQKLSNREEFRKIIRSNKQRQSLIFRIELIRSSGIKRVVIPEGVVLQRFSELHNGVSPRATRDLARIFGLAYGYALLNCFSHEFPDTRDEETIAGKAMDVDAAFDLYKPIMRANEAGTSPEIFDFYKQVIIPAFSEKVERNEASPRKNQDGELIPVAGLDYLELARAYSSREKRHISSEKLKGYTDALVLAGLVFEDKDPLDRRKNVFRPVSEDIYQPAVRQRVQLDEESKSKTSLVAHSGSLYISNENVSPYAGLDHISVSPYAGSPSNHSSSKSAPVSPPKEDFSNNILVHNELVLSRVLENGILKVTCRDHGTLGFFEYPSAWEEHFQNLHNAPQKEAADTVEEYHSSWKPGMRPPGR